MHADNEQTHTSRPSGPRSAPDLRTRRLLDIDGREWRVREVPPSPYDRRSRCCLVFEAADVARRVRDYPDDWYSQSDETLLELCEHPWRRRSDDCG